jgi:hypothetical protein
MQPSPDTSKKPTVCIPLPECSEDDIWTIACSGNLYVCGTGLEGRISPDQVEICPFQFKPHLNIIAVSPRACSSMITGLMDNPFDGTGLCPGFTVTGGTLVAPGRVQSFTCYKAGEDPCDNYRETLKPPLPEFIDPCGTKPSTPPPTAICTCAPTEGMS